MNNIMSRVLFFLVFFLSESFSVRYQFFLQTIKASDIVSVSVFSERLLEK